MNNVNTYIEKVINELITTNKLNSSKTLKLTDLLYKDKTDKTLLEYMLEKNINYHYSLVTGLIDSIEAIKIISKFDKIEEIIGIKTKIFITNIEENKTLIEYLIENNKIDKMNISTLQYDKKLVNILIKYNKQELLKKIKISEQQLFELNNNKTLLEELIELNVIDYIELPLIEYRKDIVDILKKHNRLDILNHIMFSERMLLNEELLKQIINLGYTPVINHCSLKIVNYLYNNNIPELIPLYFNSQNINDLFSLITPSESIIDYLLKSAQKGIKIDFRTIGFNIDYLSDKDFVDIYIKFSQYNKLDYLYIIEKDVLLKRDKKNNCLLDTFISKNKTETINIIKYFRLENDLDINTYFKLKGIELNIENIDLSLMEEEVYSSSPLETQVEEIKGQINYEYLGEEAIEKLIELEEVFSDTQDKDLLEAIVLSFTKQLHEGNEYAYIELQKLIEIKKQNPSLKITKSNSSYFSDIDGLHLASTEINILNHELGHLFHYYLADDAIPQGFEQLQKTIEEDKSILEKVSVFAKNLKDYENSLMTRIEEEYDEWAKEYYTKEKIEEIKEFVESSKQDKIEYYKKLGYTEEELELILEESFTLEQYMASQKRIKCHEMTNNIMASYHSEMQAISDIIDALYRGEYYNSKLYSDRGELITGTFGHGIIYYNSINSIFQEIIANYSLLIKSDRKKESLTILEEIIGKDLINMLNQFYLERMIYIDKYNKEKSL